jgi:hypothetical protein
MGGQGISLSFNGAQVQKGATEAGRVVSVVIVEPPNDLDQTVTFSFLIPRVQLADGRNSSARVQTLGITTKHLGVNPGGPINGVNEQLDTYSSVTLKGTASQMRIHAETSA